MTHDTSPIHRTIELPDELLVGAIDTHIHSGPWLKSCPGRLDPFQIAEQAKQAGMRAVVFYDHTFGNSAGTSWMVRRSVPGIDVYGGIILTTNFGGMNPRAVKTALHYGDGAKFVHFGTHCTYHMASREGSYVDGKPVPFKDLYPKFAEQELARAIRIPLDGPVPGELEEILGLVAGHPDVYLNTGHISPGEVMRLAELAERFGIRKMIVAHPARAWLSTAQQKDLSARGFFLEGSVSDWLFHRGLPRTNYYVEREYADEIAGIANEPQFQGVVQWASQLREVGLANVVLGTDYGIGSCPAPREGMRLLISTLLDLQFSLAEIELLTRRNPARLLGLE
ncbi:hypothetical protein DR64_8569 [Paraburkholderia xenovorans LB400]|uniref:Amidohydrolase-related domain-containing protein n=1 Tax=Paraburkholderia xenovorans (strain LB400) TaxID=266265 RepID=Q13FP0_PARXL|nr:DUF6282 family protein [Paraburkholderia xenovorans]ABE37099.1 Conserved hypothetical protein [Paraburkholderia xenovorans LB400]AIP34630.1 hypothetical protein DR64_8569 [Paraburkholderia xenovorans LB400]